MKKLLTIACILLFVLGSVAIIRVELRASDPGAEEVVARLEAGMPEGEMLQLQKNLARWYNLNLTSIYRDPGFSGSYGQILDLEEGAMGYLSVPALGIRLPIYHEGESKQAGAEHLACTPFPLASDRAHSALEVPFFLEQGDYFYIHCLDSTAAYQVHRRDYQSGGDREYSGREGESLCSLVMPLGPGVLRMEGTYSPSAPGEEEIVVRPEESSDGFTVAVCLILALGILLVPLLTWWGK